MALANCRKCKKLFNKLLRDVCEDCLAVEEEQLVVVQHFLLDNPRSSVFEIEEGCGVPASLAMQFAREKRITLIKVEQNKVTCKFCGREIDAGSICRSCQLKLGGETAPLAHAPSPRRTQEASPKAVGLGDARRALLEYSLIKDKFRR